MSRRVTLCLSAASAGLLVVAGLLPGSPAAANDWPPGAWDSTCADLTEQYCIESATIAPVGESPVPLAAAGMAAVAATAPSPENVIARWMSWSVQGWANQPDDITGGEVSLVIRTGSFVPRMTSAAAEGLRVSRSDAGQGNYTLTITGQATHVDWTTGPNAETCVDQQYCGEADDMADEAGTGYRFEGRTQDLDGFSSDYIDALDGAYFASDAQARTSDLTYGVATDPYLWLGTLGNPQLDINGDPVRNFVTAWVPAAYFTEIGTTVDDALTTGFDVVVTGTSIPAVAWASDGGVRLSIMNIGIGNLIKEILVFHRAAVAGPMDGAPGPARDITVTGAQDSVTVSWTAPASDGGRMIAGYRARAFSAATDGTVVSRCDAESEATTTCLIQNLTDDETYYVTVGAYNALGEGEAAARVSVVAGDPVRLLPPSEPQLVQLTPGPNRIGVSWLGPDDDGGAPVENYTARAYRLVSGGTMVASCRAVEPARTCTLIAGLPKGGKVYVGVTATNSEGDGPQSGRPSATAWTAASPVRGLAGKSAKSRITATWLAPTSTGGTPITSYRADFYTTATGGSPAYKCTAGGGSRYCTSGLLKPGRTLYVSVTALNAAGSSVQPARVKVLVRA